MSKARRYVDVSFAHDVDQVEPLLAQDLAGALVEHGPMAETAMCVGVGVQTISGSHFWAKGTSMSRFTRASDPMSGGDGQRTVMYD
ncbi:MAG: hypothetical protein CMO26_23020 [Thiotrichales bacterium]|nr:hypothetical protein [Thiotrichales bacterium]